MILTQISITDFMIKDIVNINISMFIEYYKLEII